MKKNSIGSLLTLDHFNPVACTSIILLSNFHFGYIQKVGQLAVYKKKCTNMFKKLKETKEKEAYLLLELRTVRTWFQKLQACKKLIFQFEASYGWALRVRLVEEVYSHAEGRNQSLYCQGIMCWTTLLVLIKQ